MNKVSQLTVLIVPALFFVAPLLASAQQTVGGACLATSDCAQGLTCDYSTGEGVCTDLSGGGGNSGGGAGTGAVGDACSTGADCASGSCVYSSEARMNLCAASLKSLGQTCSSASECSSDYCAYDSEIKANVCQSPTSQTGGANGSGGGCVPGDQCVTGNQVYGYCDANGVCQPDSGTNGSGVPVGSGGGSGGGAGGTPGSSGAINLTYLQGYKDSIINIINNYLVPMLMALAFIVFLWGIYKYFILGAAEEGEKAEGRNFALWGVIGFVIILSLWGIVNIVRDTLNFSQGGNNVPAYPKL